MNLAVLMSCTGKNPKMNVRMLIWNSQWNSQEFIRNLLCNSKWCIRNIFNQCLRLFLWLLRLVPNKSFCSCWLVPNECSWTIILGGCEVIWTSSCRNFSGFSRLKTYLRSTIGQTHLNSKALIYIERVQVLYN